MDWVKREYGLGKAKVWIGDRENIDWVKRGYGLGKAKVWIGYRENIDWVKRGYGLGKAKVWIGYRENIDWVKREGFTMNNVIKVNRLYWVYFILYKERSII